MPFGGGADNAPIGVLAAERGAVRLAGMKRVTQLPWVVGLVVLMLAAVPVFTAWQAYRGQARRAGDLLFNRSAEVVAAQLSLRTARQLAWQNTLRLRLSGRVEPPEQVIEELFTRGGRMELLEDCRELVYAEKEGERLVVRWRRAEEGSGGDTGWLTGRDLTGEVWVGTLLGDAMDRPVRPASVQRGGELVTMLMVTEVSSRKPRGWLVARWDLNAMCAERKLGDFAVGQALEVRPLGGVTEPGALEVAVNEGGASWRATVKPGAGDGAVFPAVSARAIAWSGGACAVLLAGLAGFAVHAAGLRAALAAERELVGMKNHLLHSVSHELRTPLSVILSSTELLEAYAERLPPVRKAAVFTQIREASRQMEDMVGRILLLGRIEARRMPVTPKPVEVAGWLRALAGEAEAAQGTPGRIEVVAPDGVTVEVDPELLRAVLGNLLSNALKFSGEGKAVRVEVARSAPGKRETAGGWTFTVQDRGGGIAPEEMARVREAFFRGPSAMAAGVPGSGLGLAIADKCTELLGGTLILTSDPTGTRAELHLP